jgi:hypothetical protein
VATNKAIGSTIGNATVVQGEPHNRGKASVEWVAGNSGKNSIQATTVDCEMHERKKEVGEVAIIKIDVEGAEHEVLKGAKDTIRTYRPLLCIEAHSGVNLYKVMTLLREDRYWIIDCLGNSPTYIIEPTDTFVVRRFFRNLIWLFRAVLPIKRLRHRLKPGKRLRRYLKKISKH